MLKTVKCVLCMPEEEPQQITVSVKDNLPVYETFFYGIECDPNRSFGRPPENEIINLRIAGIFNGLRCVSWTYNACKVPERVVEYNHYASVITELMCGGPVLFYHIPWKVYETAKDYQEGDPEITDLLLSDFRIIYGFQMCQHNYQ